MIARVCWSYFENDNDNDNDNDHDYDHDDDDDNDQEREREGCGDQSAASTQSVDAFRQQLRQSYKMGLIFRVKCGIYSFAY